MSPLPPALVIGQPLRPAELFLYLLSVCGSTPLSGAAMIAVGKLFGLPEGRSRTALSRLVTTGKLRNEAGYYRFAPHAATTNRRLQRIRWPKARPNWKNDWLTVLLPDRPLRSSERRRAYHALRLARFFAQQPGVWIRPDNLALPVRVMLQPVRDELPDLISGQLLNIHGSLPLPPVNPLCRTLHRQMKAFLRQPPKDREQLLTESFLLGGAVIEQIHYALFLPPTLQPQARHEWQMLDTFRQFNRYSRRHWMRWLRAR